MHKNDMLNQTTSGGRWGEASTGRAWFLANGPLGRRGRHFGARVWGMVFCLMVVFAAISSPESWAAAPSVSAPLTPGNVVVRVEGRYEAPDRAALVRRINEIRLEAYRQGLVDQYQPVAWATGLEEIARLRAGELVVVQGHDRPNGAVSPFLTASNGISNSVETLAFNSQGMARGVEQFYEEKADFLAERAGRKPSGPTGHYRSMIHPDLTTVGGASFYSDDLRTYQVAFVFSSQQEKTPLNLPALPTFARVEVLGDRVKSLSLAGSSPAGAGAGADSGAADGGVVSASLSAGARVSASARISRYDIFDDASELVTLPVLGGLAWESQPVGSAFVDGAQVTFARAAEVTLQARLGNLTASVRFAVAGAGGSGVGAGTDGSGGTGTSGTSSEAFRIAGANREEVAATVATRYFADAESVILVSAQAFGDAISATNLSQGRAPILYVQPGALPEATLSALRVIRPSSVTLMGGTTSIGPAVEAAVRRAVPAATVRRLGGRDRFEVNAKTLTAGKSLVVVNGLVFSDALVAAPYAYTRKAQVALVSPGAVPAGVLRSVDALPANASLSVIGGPASVFPATLSSLARRRGRTVPRITAADRYALSAEVAAAFSGGASGATGVGGSALAGNSTSGSAGSALAGARTMAILTSGEKFPDALVAGPLSQKLGAPILLTRRKQVSGDVLAQLRQRSSVMILGGPASIADSAVQGL